LAINAEQFQVSQALQTRLSSELAKAWTDLGERTRATPDELLRYQLAEVVQTGPINRKQRRARKLNFSAALDIGRPKSLEERAYDRLSEFKILTSRVAMHLDDAWRTGLFGQLDFLLKTETWPEDVALPSTESYSTFLKFLIYLRPHKRPSFGVGGNENLVATWRDGDARLFVDFQHGDDIRWAATQTVAGRQESTAGQSSITRLMPHLGAFQPERWFAANG
jgi:hypothetical protein